MHQRGSCQNESRQRQQQHNQAQYVSILLILPLSRSKKAWMMSWLAWQWRRKGKEMASKFSIFTSDETSPRTQPQKKALKVLWISLVAVVVVAADGGGE